VEHASPLEASLDMLIGVLLPVGSPSTGGPPASEHAASINNQPSRAVFAITKPNGEGRSS